MDREPNKKESVSIANAVQLLREVGYDDKANELDDLLQIGEIIVKKQKAGVTGAALKDIFGDEDEEPLFSTIELSPKLLPRNRILERCDAGLIELAGVLLHECTHLDCFDELAAWGTEIAAFKRIRKNLVDLTEECDDGTRALVALQIDRLITESTRVRRDIAKKGGPGYGDEKTPKKPPVKPVPEKPKTDKPIKKFFFLSFPSEPTNPEDHLLCAVGDAIWEYRDKTGAFPPDGSNAEWVGALREIGLCPVPLEELSETGEILDDRGQPLVYRADGKLFRDFDLYSLGTSGVDEGGLGDNRLFINRRH